MSDGGSLSPPPPESASGAATPRRAFLERALVAEERVDALLERIADLESRLKAAMNADPTTASRALSWVGRAENAEELLRIVVQFAKQRSISSTDLPPGWLARAEAQLASVVVLRRDQHQLAERPERADDYWTTSDDPKGRRGIVRDGP